VVNVTGTLGRTAQGGLTIEASAAPRLVRLVDGVRLEQEGSGSPSDLVPGQFVVVIASPEGGAASIRVYPQGLLTPRPGKVLLAGSQQGKIATFGSISSVQRSSLTVSAAGQTVLFGLSSATDVRKPVPASPADLTAGRRVVASGVIGIDGVLAASALSLPGTPLQTVQ